MQTRSLKRRLTASQQDRRFDRWLRRREARRLQPEKPVRQLFAGFDEGPHRSSWKGRHQGGARMRAAPAADRPGSAAGDGLTMRHRPLTQADGDPGPTTLERVAALIEWGFGTRPAAITADSLFVEDLGIDEIAFVLVIAAAEDEFSTPVPDAEAMRMRSVGDLVAWLDAAQVAPADRITS